MRKLFRAVVAGLLVASTAVAHAQSWPSKPVRLVVPYTPGAGTDTISRILAQKLGDQLGQPVVVDNRPGAGGTIGTEIVARAVPDGYTLLFTPTSHAINSNLYPKLGYDTLKDFAPISVVASLPVVLAVDPSLKVQSVKELVALAKSKPGALSMASSGNGTVFHLTGELFKDAAGISILHVPFKGGAPAVAALLGGQVSMTFETSVTLVPHIRSGKLRALGVASAGRIALLPEVPTLGETGFQTILSENWYGLFAPAKTTDTVVALLADSVVKALQVPEVLTRLSGDGAIPVGSSPKAFFDFFQAEKIKWAAVAQKAKVTVD